jgi:hypothetical protein
VTSNPLSNRQDFSEQRTPCTHITPVTPAGAQCTTGFNFEAPTTIRPPVADLGPIYSHQDYTRLLPAGVPEDIIRRDYHGIPY